MNLIAGSDVDTIGIGNKTALHYATCRGYVADVNILLNGGADPHLVDRDGDGCLHLAAREACADVIEVLISVDCDVNSKNILQMAPLHLAAIKGHVRTTKLLVEAGANPNDIDTHGNIPLWYTAYHGHSRTVLYFITRNVRLGSYTENGTVIYISNPLRAALQRRHLTVAKILVMAGCDVMPLYDWLNNIPPGCATDYRSCLYIDWFREYSANPANLKELCRWKIRTCIGIDFVGKEKDLPLPNALQEYLVMGDLEEEPVSYVSTGTGMLSNMAFDLLQGFPNMYT